MTTARALRAAAPTPCPACGPVGRLVPHLVEVHAFGRTRAKSLAGKVAMRTRLARSECLKLGIPMQPVKTSRGHSLGKLERDAVPAGLPSDEVLSALVARAFPR